MMGITLHELTLFLDSNTIVFILETNGTYWKPVFRGKLREITDQTYFSYPIRYMHVCTSSDGIPILEIDIDPFGE